MQLTFAFNFNKISLYKKEIIYIIGLLYNNYKINLFYINLYEKYSRKFDICINFFGKYSE